MSDPIYPGSTVRLPYSLKVPKTVTAVDTSTGALTATAHGFSNGQQAYMRVTAGALPSGFLSTVAYYVVGVTADTLQLALTPGGAAVKPTDAGSGFIEVLAGADPATVTLTVRQPDGTETPTYTYAGGTVTKAAVGIYYKDYTNTSLVGPYEVRYVTTSPATSLQYSFVVVANNI